MDLYDFKARLKMVKFKFQNLREQKRQVVFVGDSLTARCDLKKFYPKYNAVNRGISGDALAHLSRRMKSSVYALCPCAIVFLMGINDLAFYACNIKSLFDLQEKVFAQWRENYLYLPIIVQSLYPVIDDDSAEFELREKLNDTIVEVNKGLRVLAEKYNLIYVDVHSLLINGHMLDKRFASDCLHLNDKGYEVVSRAVGSALDKALGGEVIDILSKVEYPSNMLSNFYPHKFVVRGIECASMEGFLQSLKYKNARKQREVCKLFGKEAKAAGSKRRCWKLTQTLYFNNKPLKRNSAELKALICEAYDNLLENDDFCNALKATNGKILDHTIGCDNPKKTVLTRKEFLDNLYRLRNKIN